MFKGNFILSEYFYSIEIMLIINFYLRVINFCEVYESFIILNIFCCELVFVV